MDFLSTRKKRRAYMISLSLSTAFFSSISSSQKETALSHAKSSQTMAITTAGRETSLPPHQSEGEGAVSPTDPRFHDGPCRCNCGVSRSKQMRRFLFNFSMIDANLELFIKYILYGVSFPTGRGCGWPNLKPRGIAKNAQRSPILMEN